MKESSKKRIRKSIGNTGSLLQAPQLWPLSNKALKHAPIFNLTLVGLFTGLKLSTCFSGFLEPSQRAHKRGALK